MNVIILSSISSIEITSRTSDVVSFMDDILRLQDIGYTEGLLGLEEEVQKDYYEENPSRKILKEIILCITGGWEPEVIKDIFVTRYFSSKMTAADSLCYILALYGSLAIQNGYTREQLEAQLVAIIPDNVKTKYNEKKKIKSLMDSFDDELSELVSTLICNLTDDSLQHVLSNITRRDLALAMTVLTDKAKEKVYFNLSAKYTDEINRMIVELSCCLVVSKLDITDAVTKLMNEILKDNTYTLADFQESMKTVRKIQQ